MLSERLQISRCQLEQGTSQSISKSEGKPIFQCCHIFLHTKTITDQTAKLLLKSNHVSKKQLARLKTEVFKHFQIYFLNSGLVNCSTQLDWCKLVKENKNTWYKTHLITITNNATAAKNIDNLPTYCQFLEVSSLVRTCNHFEYIFTMLLKISEKNMEKLPSSICV